jgi:3-oxoacyl-(acyl-carrier-protein) synthase
MLRRLAVTGIGVISALDCTREAFWQGLPRGASAIRPLPLVPPGSLKFANGAEVAGFHASSRFYEKEASLLDRFAHAATLFALHERMIPHTANFTEPDPVCDFDVAPNLARSAEVEWALSNSFAFGGLNAVLVFRKA